MVGNEMSIESLPTVSAIVPVYNGGEYLGKSLPPLLSMIGRGLIEVIVVDDSSDDGSRELAERLGARVIPSGGRLGPAASRNQGARAAQGDVLLLVDADVGVHPDAVEKVQEALASTDVAAVFGSYDDRPTDPGFWSQYKNLLHHHTHQSAGEEASTFWTGLSAIRRDVLLECGGFDSGLFSRPSIEDIELGYRLRASGMKIRLLHELQGTHFKRWTLGELLETDIFRRALPWSRLILESSHSKADLNTRPGEMARAGAALGFVGGLALAAGGFVPLWIAAVPLFVGVGSNPSLASLFYRRNGPLFALAGLLFHQVYYLYSSAAFAWCYASHRLRPFRKV
jgi:glycosyltransferase involved in cell wall biosynthesis